MVSARLLASYGLEWRYVLFGDLADANEKLAILGARHVGMPLLVAIEAKVEVAHWTLQLRMRGSRRIGDARRLATISRAPSAVRFVSQRGNEAELLEAIVLLFRHLLLDLHCTIVSKYS